MSNLTLEAIELTRLFGGREAVKNVSFHLEKGEVLGFLGPNGAGKSTTMRMLTGNLAPSIGTVKICGVDMIENPKEAKALIGYLPEMRPIYKELTVDEFLTIAARLHKVPSKQIKKAVDIAKEKCGLSHMSKRLIENLSNGYQQRVAIAQAIIHNPLVVILDEPTVGLDPIQIREIRSLIREIGQKHSVILSTHILPEVEMVCDRVQIIDKGNLVFHGSIDELKQHRQGHDGVVGQFGDEQLVQVPNTHILSCPLRQKQTTIEMIIHDGHGIPPKPSSGRHKIDPVASLRHDRQCALVNEGTHRIQQNLHIGRLPRKLR